MLTALVARLSASNISHAAFAKSLGYSKGHMSDVLSGKRPASIDMCIAIEREVGITLEPLAQMRVRVGNAPAEQNAAA